MLKLFSKSKKEDSTDDQISYEDTLVALRRIRRSLPLTPLTHSDPVSELTGVDVRFKWDNKLRTGSFKERGAVNVLSAMKESGTKGTVCAASAGNHALALSYHARYFEIPCVLVMPKGAPLVKVQAAANYGAEIILEGDTFDEAYRYAKNLSEEKSFTFVSPFDDPLIIAGQGTLAHELLEQSPDFDSVIVPVGGGGLIAGISLVLKHIRPEVFVLGVQSEWAANHQQLKTKPAIPPVTIADGIAVKTIGTYSGPLVQRHVDKLVSLSENEIASSIFRFLELERAVVEGAGAVSLAALVDGHLPSSYRKPIVVVSGSNIDLNVLGRLISREIAGKGRLLKVRLSVPDRPGSLYTISGIIAESGANVLEVLHDRSFAAAPANVEITFLLEVRDGSHREALLKQLEEHGILVREL